MRTPLLVAILVAGLAFSPADARAQDAPDAGSRAAYERAATIGERARGHAGLDLQPNWAGDGSSVWIRAGLPGGGWEYRATDTATGRTAPAFDHEAMAVAIIGELGHPVAATHLPILRAHIESAGRATLLIGSRNEARLARLDGETITLEAIDDATPFDLRTYHPIAVIASSGGGPATTIVLVNRTDHPVRIDWIDGQRQARSYGKLEPGQAKVQPTFAGHVWRATRLMDETSVGRFWASEQASVARIGQAQRIRPMRHWWQSSDDEWVADVKPKRLTIRSVSDRTAPSVEFAAPEGRRFHGVLEWSPDNRHVLVGHQDDMERKRLTLVESTPSGSVVPKTHEQPYARPGETLERPRLAVFDVENERATWVDEKQLLDPYNLTHTHWAKDGSSVYFVHNERGHQKRQLMAVDVPSGKVRVVIDETSKTFIDYSQKTSVYHLESSNEVLWMTERSGWNHLILVDRATGEVKREVTSGEWVVRAVEHVDEANRRAVIRVMGRKPGEDPYHQHFAVVGLDDGKLTPLTEGDGTHALRWSPGRKFYVDSWSRVDAPPVHELRRADGSLVTVLAKATAPKTALTPTRFHAKGRDGKTDIWGILHFPSTHDPKKRYPVIEQIYAGPQGHHVPKSYRPIHGPQALAELGFIVVQIDGMGTNWRSKAFHDACWKNLKDAGFPDRIAWMRAAAKMHPSMDLSRVGIYGGSAGGQNAMRAVLDHHDVYKAAAADCGCHDNRVDKVWWNEAWMGYPVDATYAASSNAVDAHKLGGKLLLTVGELDRNVDPASTYQVVKALIDADKDFELIVFPGKGHGAGESKYGVRRRNDFFVRNLLGVEPRWE